MESSHLSAAEEFLKGIFIKFRGAYWHGRQLEAGSYFIKKSYGCRRNGCTWRYGVLPHIAASPERRTIFIELSEESKDCVIYNELLIHTTGKINNYCFPYFQYDPLLFIRWTIAAYYPSFPSVVCNLFCNIKWLDLD